jgi:hypothetical protein
MRWPEFGLRLKIRSHLPVLTPTPLRLTIGPFKRFPSTDILFNTTNKKKEAVNESVIH